MMNNQSTSPFHYQELDEETRAFVQQKAYETHGFFKRTAEHVLAIGQNLKAVKERLPYGQFLQWIETEFEMSRWTARNLINVADKLEDKWRFFHHLPISVLYELASPSTPETILEQIQTEHLAPTRAAIKEAKDAEKQARDAEQQAHQEKEQVQHHLQSVQEEIHDHQKTIEQLTQEIAQLQSHRETHMTPAIEIREVEKYVVSPKVEAQLEQLNQQLQTLTRQRDTLTQRVIQLEEEAKTAALKHQEGTHERRIRLNWYKLTHDFQSTIVKILAQWPSPLDAEAFEADDWAQLSQIQRTGTAIFRRMPYSHQRASRRELPHNTRGNHKVKHLIPEEC